MKLRAFICLLLSTSLAACSYITTPAFIKNHDKQYLSARSIPPLRTPPGISGDAFHNDYPVSDRTYPNNAKNIDLVPPGL